jgi:LacI family gluconate utilization system Gnt-I transcriptional repressor
MDDVARLARVSQMTVSRALSTPEKVSAATRARIEAAMTELDYIPDLVASGLAARRSGLIAAIVSTLENSIFAETIQGLTDSVTAAGYSILLGASSYSAADEERLLRTVIGRRPDGIVVTDSIHTRAARRLFATCGIPVVETWQLPKTPIDMAVGFSNIAAGRAMVQALASYGYRRIVFVGTRSIKDRRSRQRLIGYRRALADLGIPERREVCVSTAMSTIADGARALDDVLRFHPDAEVIFCSVDNLAAGIVLECRRRGLAVPGRFGVAGFGDFPIAHPAAVDMTTVRIDGRGMGERAGALLLARLRGHTIEAPVIDQGFEIIRRSTA